MVSPDVPGTKATVVEVLNATIVDLPEAHQQAASTFVQQVVALLREIPSATHEDADLALRGLTTLIERARGFLAGGRDGEFLREVVDVPAQDEEDAFAFAVEELATLLGR